MRETNTRRSNLPQLPYFFGRQKDLDIIATALRPDDRTWIVLIDGPGGIGKTTLAIRAAEHVPERDYSRVVFVSSKRSELEPDGLRTIRDFRVSDYLEILDAIARELGELNFERLDARLRPAALHSLLRESPALLIIDNLESLSEDDRLRVVEFLKNLPQGTKAIITSRFRTDLQAAMLRLEHIPWEDAAQLLHQIARNNKLLASTTEDERRALHKECGGNPLIMRWVAGQLGRGQCRSIACALELLRQSPAGEAALAFIFSDIAKNLSDEEMRLMSALAHFRLPTEVKHVAELSGVSSFAAKVSLENLADRALVIADAEMQVFVLTPLIAGFLQRTRPEAVEKTGDLLAQQAYALVVQNGYENRDRFAKVELAWPMVAAALPLFLAGANNRLQIVCSALVTFLESSGRFDESLTLATEAEAKAVAAEDFDQAGWRAHQIGMVNFHQRKADEVLACANRASSHWHRSGAGGREQAAAIHLRGRGFESAGDFENAVRAYRTALEIDQTVAQESWDVACGVYSLAIAERLAGDLDAAERGYREILRIAKILDDQGGGAAFSGRLIDLAMARQDWPGAEFLGRNALQLCESVGRSELVAINCHGIALALTRQGKKPEGVPYARRAVDLFTKLGSPRLEYARETLHHCET